MVAPAVIAGSLAERMACGAGLLVREELGLGQNAANSKTVELLASTLAVARLARHAAAAARVNIQTFMVLLRPA